MTVDIEKARALVEHERASFTRIPYAPVHPRLSRVELVDLIADLLNEVERLNSPVALSEWQKLVAERDALAAENLRLAGEVANRNRRALEGDESKAAFNRLYDKMEKLRIERDAAVLAEREECAQECDAEAEFALRCGDGDRSGMYEWQADGAEKCAAAIRARSER